MIEFRAEKLSGRGGDEWLLTNGLGGFAMGSVRGIADRRYHAWLIAALSPPVGRFAALSACAERLVVEDYLGEQHWDLSSHRFAGGVVSPRGVDHLTVFAHGQSVSWVYQLTPLLKVTRTLMFARHVNAIAVEYKIEGLSAEQKATLLVSPLVAMRDFHELLTPASRESAPHVVERPGPDEIFVKRFGVRLHARMVGAEFRARGEWWRGFEYVRDEARGQEHAEDLFCPGYFEAPVPASGVVVLRANVGEQVAAIDVSHARELEESRLDAMASVVEVRCGVSREVSAAMALAADRFVVRRATAGGRTFASVIAGYPWFSDWGRDTCISLPGLLMTTGREREAFEALRAFGELRKDGLIPNCFDNGTGEAEYNTVDAPLWYMQACAAYVEATGDLIGARDVLLPACRDIIAAYRGGTKFGIGVDASDGLVCAGDESTQLTWMDARRDGVVFTPRHGKPVEINALWCSSLRRMAAVTRDVGEEVEAAGWEACAERCSASMVRLMWRETDGWMSDCLRPQGKVWVQSEEFRPNQLFAVSLPGAPITGERARRLVSAVERELLTPVGLRTLASGSGAYEARFEGTLFERDRAYHNGTVWPWLIGPFGEAMLRADGFSVAAKARVRGIIAPMVAEFVGRGDGGSRALLSVPEVYDADEPRRPDGCPMQAWSVAELMRLLSLTRL